MTDAAVPAPKPPSVWEDFVDIFTSPSQVFERRQNSGFGLQLIVLTVIVFVIYLGTRSLLQPLFDNMFDKQMALMQRQNPGMTSDQIERARGFGQKIAMVSFLFATPIIVLLIGLVSWLVGKFFDAKQTLRAAFMVATYAYFPKILATVAAAAIAYFTDPARLTYPGMVTLGPALLVGPDASPVLGAILTRLDVFTIWVTILIAIGLHITGKIPKSKAYAAAVVVWLIGAIPSLLGAMRQAR